MVGHGGTHDTLRRRYHEDGWKMRDEPGDDVSDWLHVTEEGGREGG